MGRALLDALEQRPAIRAPVIEIFKRLKYYEAIDPLIAIAAGTDKKAAKEALDGLRVIADPDREDIPRLVKLLLAVEGERREEVERTILIVCEKVPAGTDRAEPVLAVLAKVEPEGIAEIPAALGKAGWPEGPQIDRFGPPEQRSGREGGGPPRAVQLAQRRNRAAALGSGRPIGQQDVPAMGACGRMSAW